MNSGEYNASEEEQTGGYWKDSGGRDDDEGDGN